MNRITTSKHIAVDRRLELALDHLQAHWIPPNESHLQNVRERIARGEFNEEVERLVAEIQTDPALFTLCLHRAAQGTHGETAHAYPSPVEFLRAIGLEGLREILDSIGTSSTHSLDSMTAEQQARYEESFVSIAASEVLCERGGLDGDSGYAAALLRQLGYMLVAWNYPHVYERAVKSLTPTESLDIILARHLGFSPLTLALHLARRWKVASTICDALTPTEPNPECDTLKSLCEIGETLARANAPSVYPTAREDWERAAEMIALRLGRNGLKIVREKLERHTAHLGGLLPQGLDLEPERRIRKAYRHLENPYLTGCAAEVRHLLQHLYEEDAQRENVTRIRFLVDEVFARAGLAKACIFTVDPGTVMLIPQLTVGKLSCRILEPVPYPRSIPSNDIVSKAFRDARTYVDEATGPEGDTYACVATALQNQVGVLYAELPAADFNSQAKEHLIHLKAITRALEQALQIG